MPFDEFWNDFDFNFGPFRLNLGPFARNIRYARTENTHILRIHIDPSVKKEEIKARLVEAGLIEVEWPRRQVGDEIPVD